MSEDFLDSFISGVGTFFILCLVFFISFRRPPRQHTSEGVMTSPAGQEYDYVYGDNLFSYAAFGYFNGIDIQLPVEMPHIYLDSLKAGGNEVSAVFDVAQRINLEGDFPQYFNVFVPAKYEAVALSVLTPDVMEILEKYASCFDVEIYGSHLRVISNKKVKDDDVQLAIIMQVAERIIEEIEGRMRSWTVSNTLESIDQDLHTYPNRGLRIFGRYITWARIWLSIWWFLCAGSFVWIGIWMFTQGLTVLGVAVAAIGICLYILLQIFSFQTQAGGRFWSRRS